MSSAFNLLTAGGAKFDTSRFSKDIELFSAKTATSKSKGKAKAKTPAQLSHLPSTLSSSTAAHPRATSPAPSAASSSRTSGSSSSSRPALPAPPKQKITLSGSEPLPKSLHANLPSLVTHLPSSAGAPLLSALQTANIHSLWGVQSSVGGCLLADPKRNVMCIAPTGSGKTLAYVLPILVNLQDPARTLRRTVIPNKDKGKSRAGGDGIRSVVLVPTHDLAVQIEGVIKAVTRGRAWRVMVLTKATGKAVCESAPGAKFGSSDSDGEESDSDGNGEDQDDAEKQLGGKLGIDILIATPERLHQLIGEELVSLASTAHVVLDEADRLLGKDFLPQVIPILDACTNPAIQKAFFSATMPSGVEAIAKAHLGEDGVRVVVGLKDSAVTTISQELIYTSTEPGKLLALRNLLSSGSLPYPSLIFVQSITRAEELHRSLSLDGVRVDMVHGGLSMTRRDEAISAYREGRVWVLVGTEVLGRGMDFGGVKVVLNYDFPQTVQSYIHRIGRTGRAGRPGRAITFFSNEDQPYLRTIANVLRASGCPVPPYLLDLAPPSKNTKRKLAQAPPERKSIGEGGRDVGKEQARKRRDMKEGSKRRAEKEARGQGE